MVVEPYLKEKMIYGFPGYKYNVTGDTSKETFIFEIETGSRKKYLFRIKLTEKTVDNLTKYSFLMCEPGNELVPIIIYPMLVTLISEKNYMVFYHDELKVTLVKLMEKNITIDKFLLDKKNIPCTMLIREKNNILSFQLYYDKRINDSKVMLTVPISSIGEICGGSVQSYKKGTRRRKEII